MGRIEDLEGVSLLEDLLPSPLRNCHSVLLVAVALAWLVCYRPIRLPTFRLLFILFPFLGVFTVDGVSFLVVILG